MKTWLSSLLLLCSTSLFAQEVTLINPFVVPKQHEQAAIDHWEKARDFLKNQPGYISTSLHQAIQPDSTYFLINVAKWASQQDFESATARMRQEIPPLKLDGVSFYPGLYQVIRN